MRAENEDLLVLQDRDQKIKSIQNQQKSLPRDRKLLEDKLIAVRAAFDLSRQQLRENEVERRKLELDVQGKQISIGRFKTQQQQTRKNEEYQALTHEIARFEKDIGILEDQELVLMEKAEALQGVLNTAENDFTRAEKSIQEQLANLEASAKAGSDRLVKLLQERAQAASKVPEADLALYERLFSKKDAAVVPLNHEICGGCHVKVPTQVAAFVRAEQQTTQCPHCGRILYRVL